MAVFPDRIVLKNSSDSQASILAEIETGGPSAITQGEIVLGLTPGQTRIYTKDANGLIVSLGGADVAPLYIGDLVDVDTATNPPVANDALIYNGTDWVPQAVSLNDLSDVQYSVAGALRIDGLDEIFFDSTDIPEGINRKIYTNLSYGLALASYGDSSGSYLFLHETKGIDLRAEVDIIRLSGDSSETTNQPELRWESGDASGAAPNGNHIGLKLPAGLTVNQTYILPLLDGTDGQVLVTDGAGVLSWADGGTGGGGTGGLVFWGGGNFTTGASDGEPPDGGLFTTLP